MDAVGTNIRVDSRGNEVMRILPRLNEDINEDWISDKPRYVYDGLNKRRLDKPYVRRDGKQKPVNWNAAFAAIKDGLSGLQGENIAALAGDLQDVESMFALKGLLTALGSDQTECRLNGEALDPGLRANYVMNSTIAGIEEADELLIIGSNPRLEAAIINARILKATRHNGLKVMNLGPERDFTYPAEQLGDDLSILKNIAAGEGDVFRRLNEAARPMILIGQGALARSDGQAIFNAAVKLAHATGVVCNEWNGFNVLHTAASRVGALDIGFATDGGMPAITEKAKAGDIKAVFLLGVDDIDLSAFTGALRIYIGTHGDIGAHSADIILPSATYTEKAGLYVNTEGRVQQAPRAIYPPGDAREDWTIFRALSDVLGCTLPYNSLPELRAMLRKDYPHFEAIDEIVMADGTPKAVGRAAAISDADTPLPIETFYLTNPIARAAETMLACVAEILNAGVDEKATGTHG